jgi:carbon monoxide dehydrogenase subunit G
MAKANVAHEIPADPETTWKVLSDVSRYDEWLTIHDKFYGEPPTEIGEGTAFTQQATIMGMSNKIDWVVQQYDAPRSMTINGKGLAGADITFVMAVAPNATGGSTTTIDAEFTGQMVVGAIGAAIERASVKECEASLAKLAELVG